MQDNEYQPWCVPKTAPLSEMKEDLETRIIGLEKELNDARREAAISDGDRIEMHARSKATKRRLSICLNELDK